MRTETRPAAPKTVALPATERAAKIKMTKLVKLHDAARGAKMAVSEKAHETGWSEEMFKEFWAFDAEMMRIYDEMVALRDACKAKDWYVTCSLIRYHEGCPSVHANRD